MTCKEKLKLDHPEWSDTHLETMIAVGCPESYGYLDDPETCDAMAPGECEACWDREIPMKEGRRVGHLIIDDLVPEEPIEKISNAGRGHRAKIGVIDEWSQEDSGVLREQVEQATLSIKSSGKTTEFETGAHRDSRENKGRCDLIPLEVAGEWLNDDILSCIAQFQTHGSTSFLYGALNYFIQKAFNTKSGKFHANALLEVSKHYEEGAEKYGADNWKKGIPVYIYIDSAVRHYLKWLRGDKDEPHDRAFVWNLMCCIWEVDCSGRHDKCEEATDD